MKKLVVMLLLASALFTGCGREVKETVPVMSNEEAIQLLTPYGLTEVVEVHDLSDYLLINGYVNGEKRSVIYKHGKVITMFNPDNATVQIFDNSADALDCLQKYTAINIETFSQNMELLSKSGFGRDCQLASFVGNKRILSIESVGQELWKVVTVGTTYTYKTPNDYTVESNNYSIKEYMPILQQTFNKAVNTTAFEKLTNISVPITVTQFAKQFPKGTSLSDCIMGEGEDETSVFINLKNNDNLDIKWCVSWNDESVAHTDESLNNDSNQLCIKYTPQEDISVRDIAAMLNSFGAPNRVYLRRSDNWVHYTAIYNLLDDLAADAIVIEFDEELWDVGHNIKGLTISYNNHSRMEALQPLGTCVYSSTTLLEEILNYAG